MIEPDLDMMPPRVASDVFAGNVTSIKELCGVAGIAYKYSGGNQPYVGCARGTGNRRAVDADNHRVLVVDLSQFSAASAREEALRVLEVSAHSFHEYAARECVRGLFGYQRNAPASGQPPRAVMTAAQRKASQRRRAQERGICTVCLQEEARDERTTCVTCATQHLRAQRARRSRSKS